jgi:prepilin-type N-terminal cleavage/methylation domain-containing protein
MAAWLKTDRKLKRSILSMMSILSTPSKASIARPLPRAGFTLIELIAAMAIFMILVGALIVGVNNAFDTWQGASSRTRTLGRGRAALGLIVEDLLQATTLSNAFTLGANRAEFDRIAPAPSAVGVAPDGRVIWRVESTNTTSTLIREITYATNAPPRLTEVLDGATRLLFAAIWEDAAAESVTEVTTNVLPASIDVFLELVPPDALRKAAGIVDPTKRIAFLTRQTLPLTTRVTFPHSRVPPLALSTNTVTLAGQVYRADGTPLAVAIDLAGGQTGVIQTDNGVYGVTARQAGRPIRVTPQEPSGERAGRYTPQWRVWWPASGSRDGADFVWRESDVTISGVITRKGTAERVAGVILDFPMAGQAITGGDGAYRIGVDAGWPYDGSEARVTPVHPRYPGSVFEAVGTTTAYHRYQAVTTAQTNRDYVWIPPEFVLTGEVTCVECRAPLAGVRLRTDSGGVTSNTFTSATGAYGLGPFPYGWSGYLSAAWLWNDGSGEISAGAFIESDVWVPMLTESLFTEFRWRPTAAISGTVTRASFDTNTVPVTITTTRYTDCPDRAEIPGGVYASHSAAIGNATYVIAVPHQWYHAAQDRILYINPANSLSGDNHGVYSPPEARFNQPPVIDASADFVWVPCDLSISGWVTNSAGGPVANQRLRFISNCQALAPTNAIQEVVLTNIVATGTPAVTTLTSVVILNATTNLASSVEIRDGFAFLFNTNRYAFAETPQVYTATTGVYTNWVSIGWSGAILPVATNRVFAPPAVLVTNLTGNLTGVVFGGD